MPITETKQGPFQIRSEATGLNWYNTLAEAMTAAEQDPSIWKVSFFTVDTDESVRLTKFFIGAEFRWVYDPIILPGFEELSYEELHADCAYDPCTDCEA